MNAPSINTSSQVATSHSHSHSQRKRLQMAEILQEVHEIIDLETNSPAPAPAPGTSKFNAISVEEFFNRRDLIDLDGDDDDDVQILCFSRASISDIGESSNSKSKPSPVKTLTRLCEICADEKTRREWFRIEGCEHKYCKDCITSYVASKLQDNVTGIACPSPGCKTGKLSPESCREILPAEVFERWGFALCEALILASEKFVYCPYKDCSAMLIDDGEESVTETCCPSCHRMFCAWCQVAWHDGIGCEEFQKLGKGEREKEDLMLSSLAKSEKWMRCPVCGFYVERTQGCLYIKCRCGSAFCYNCGSVSEDHTYHNCNNCNRVY